MNRQQIIAEVQSLFEKVTARREFAHLMVQHVYKGRNKQAHGPEFCMMCSLIGCSGKTYADISELKGQIPIKRAVK